MSYYQFVERYRKEPKNERLYMKLHRAKGWRCRKAFKTYAKDKRSLRLHLRGWFRLKKIW